MISVVSLFSGCGGLDLGFHDEDFKLKMAFDHDPAAIKCLKYNLNVAAKVLDVTSSEFDLQLLEIGSADVVLGGFPCQGFSKAGPKKDADPRNQLYLAMLKSVEKLRPKIFVGENVDGLAQNFQGSFVKKIIDDFNGIGYRVEYRILNAVNFGVPQYRRRIIFIGTLDNHKKSFEWPEPTHHGQARNGEFKTKWDVSADNLFFSNLSLKPAMNISDAISDLLFPIKEYHDHKTVDNIKQNDILILQAIKAGQKLCNVRFSESSVYTWDIPMVYGETSKRERIILETIGKNRRKKIYGNIPNGNPLCLEVISELSSLEIEEEELESLVSRRYLRKLDDKYDLTGAMFCSGLYKRPKWDEPSPTVLTVFNNPRFLAHPIEHRPFTIRECARLQSFPDDFKFLESGITVTDAYRLIGNAVPPLLALALGSSVKKYLYNNTKSTYEINAASALVQR